ncbi:hypothetical protein AAG570_000066 [Ranatra chinensis]|uniref:Zinc metalloproteinase n=1 Tax=Ranatra chinensis TaxID=642074 RepID=A0ABD0YY56_9HEMI
MTRPGRISVVNFKDGEVVCYRLVLIKGKAEGCDKVFCKSAGASAPLEFPVYGGKFKCLGVLDKGENRVTIGATPDCQDLELRLDFRPRDTRLCVVPVYVVCRGDPGTFQGPPGADCSPTSALRRLALGSQLIQCLYAEKLNEHCFGRKTFQLECDIVDDAPPARLFRSQLSANEARDKSQLELWRAIGSELLAAGLASAHSKCLALLSCTRWDGEVTSGDAALATGGLALLGSACLHTWPTVLSDVIKCFADTTKLGANLLDNSCYRGTYGACFSTTLGSACHEVGHMFNLGHPTTGIMSRGFDNTHRVFLASVHEGESFPRQAPHQATVNITIIPEIRIKQANDDLTHLSPGCATILAHHRWFNDIPQQESTILYDSTRSVVSSEAGLRVVQLRSDCGAVKKSWEMSGSGTKGGMGHPPTVPPATTLVAVDTNGTILTAPLH